MIINDDNYIEVAFEKLFKVIRYICLIWIACWIVSKLIPPDAPVDTTPFFKTDPNKPVTEIKYLNYNTGEVIYRTYGPPSREYNTKSGVNSYTTIHTSSGEVKINLTPTEIIQQLDIDYHDIRDYYGDELR